MSDAKVNLDLPTGIQNLDLTLRLTSKVYPVVQIEATAAQGTVRGSRLWSPLDDATEATAELTAISLRPLLQSYTAAPEATAPALAEVTALTLDTVLVSTTVENEATAPVATLTALTLESKLVSTIVEPDATAPTGIITGLELS